MSYIGGLFTYGDAIRIEEFCEKNKIPNHLTKEQFHVTLIQSETEFTAVNQYLMFLDITFDKYVIWKTKMDENGKQKNCLVVLLHSDKISDLHDRMLKKYNAIEKHKYSIHVTLSYDIGDNFDITTLQKMNTEEALGIDYLFYEKSNDTLVGQDAIKHNKEIFEKKTDILLTYLLINSDLSNLAFEEKLLLNKMIKSYQKNDL
jgi:hypothetical protein